MTSLDDRRRRSGASTKRMAPLPGMAGGLFPGRGSVSRMRWVDHWFGMPLCFLLGILVSLRHVLLPRADRPVREDGVIVIIKFFGLGSIMQATPLMRAIRTRYPDGRLVFLTFESNRGLLQRLGHCTDIRTIRNGSPFQFVGDVVREVLWMRGRVIDATVDLEFFSKFSTLMAVLAGGRKRIGYHLNAYWRSSLVTHGVYLNYYRHIADIFAQAGTPLDVPVSDLTLSEVPFSDGARERVERWLRENDCAPPRRLVGVNVNAGDLSLERRWPVENFVALIESLVARHPDVRIVLTGAPDELPYIRTVFDRLAESTRGVVRITAGVWSLDDFLAALGRMSCLVTNDSGPMHLGAAQHVPLVSLWGPGRPDFYAPRVPRHEVVYEGFACSPCLLYLFTAFEGLWCNHEAWCMQAIQPERVLAATERLLAPDVAAAPTGAR